MVSAIFGNWAVRPMSRICVSTGTPSALASATSCLGLLGVVRPQLQLVVVADDARRGSAATAGSPSPRNSALTMPVRLTE